MRKDQRKLDKKRKKKLEEKKRQERRAESLAYTGNKYKTDELIPALMHAEIGIYKTYVITDRTLLDRTVATSLETLIRAMRSAAMQPLAEADVIHYEVGREEDLLIENIRHSWAKHFSTEWQPPKDKLIGVLRTILGSLETMKSPGPQSQSYLKHIAGFLTKKLGVSVKGFTGDMQQLPEPEEDELAQLGRQWNSDGNLEARAELFQLATDLMRSGQAQRVINACHLLIGESSDPASDVVAQLTELSCKAQESPLTAM